MSVKLLVGLGNPGEEYAEHRHNVGFEILDRLSNLSPGFWKGNLGLSWRVALVENKEVVLLKPLTFMNRSGNPIKKALENWDFTPQDMIIVHDDLDLPLGKIKFSFDRGAGGHNGVDSIINTIGTNAFFRLRFGIGRPPGKMDVADFVLQPFRKQELEEATISCENAVSALRYFLIWGLDKTQERFN